MKQTKRQLFIFALGLIASVTVYQHAHAGDLAQSDLRKTLQDFTLDTLSGEPASLSKHRGEVTVGQHGVSPAKKSSMTSLSS